MLTVFPNKNFGQHFLHDEKIAKKIVQNLYLKKDSSIIELGPGMGILTKYLIDKDNNLFLLEKDTEYIKYLHIIFPLLKNRLIHMDFLKNKTILSSFALIGNFPYNISSRILFYILRNKNVIKDCIGMFQKEVAERIISNRNRKTYGSFSVLFQAFYDIEYIFTIPSIFFSPPPKVKSTVIRLHRKSDFKKKINESLLFKIVKVSFGQRRKKLRNTLKFLNFSESFYKIPLLDKRAEQLSVQQFIKICQKIDDKLKKIR